MKKNHVIFMVFLLVCKSVMPSSYFWESHRDGERSCCLFIQALESGVDICNPYVPCTRNAASDLKGIYDYISRILLVDKGGSFGYLKLLTQAQDFIRHVLSSASMHMYYRYEEHRSVKFYHEVSETVKSAEKSAKTSTITAAAAEKQKADEAVMAYLIKLGLARPLHGRVGK